MSNGASLMSIACRVREICQHEFTHANQIHEIWLTSGAHSSKSDDVAIVWTYRDGAFIWCRSGLHSTLRSCATGTWIWPFWEASSWTRVYSVLTQRLHSLESCADSLPPEVYTSRRISRSHEQFLEQSVPNNFCFSKRSDMVISLHESRITPISLRILPE